MRKFLIAVSCVLLAAGMAADSAHRSNCTTASGTKESLQRSGSQVSRAAISASGEIGFDR